jgi:hypothetical protein
VTNHLKNDIALTAAEWTPIGGNEHEAFSGTFDGGGHKITNVNISEASSFEYAGLFGLNVGTIQNLGVEDVTITTGNYAGALAGGSGGGKIQMCYSTGSVSGGSSVGGLVGYNNYTAIENSYSIAQVNGTGSSGSTGGLVGNVCRGSATYSYSAGLVKSNSPKVGGFVGAIDNANLAVNYYDKTVARQGDVDKAFAITTAEAAARETYAGWDFENIWAISPSVNGGYPTLRSDAAITSVDIEGAGTPTYPYKITNEAQLIALAANPGQPHQINF